MNTLSRLTYLNGVKILFAVSSENNIFWTLLKK